MSHTGYDGPWPLDAFRVWPVRQRVLRPHQSPDASRYPADDDALALHVGVFLRGGEEADTAEPRLGQAPRESDRGVAPPGDVVAGGSVFPGDGWRIRGMATDPAHQGRGLGTAVLRALVDGVAARGGGRLWCNARTTAAPFYEARGFEAEGGVFDLPPIGPHVVMARQVEDASLEAGFDLGGIRSLLERTPAVLDVWFRGMPPDRVELPEGPGLWSIRDLVGHLLHGEQDDWIVRVEHLLGPRADEPFRPFERSAMVRRFDGHSIEDLLDGFAAARRRALERLDALELGPEQLNRTGRHPTFGEVTLRQLLASWAAHDLSHLAQAARILAAPVAPYVGPWAEFIRIARR